MIETWRSGGEGDTLMSPNSAWTASPPPSASSFGFPHGTTISTFNGQPVSVQGQSMHGGTVSRQPEMALGATEASPAVIGQSTVNSPSSARSWTKSAERSRQESLHDRRPASSPVEVVLTPQDDRREQHVIHAVDSGIRMLPPPYTYE